MSISAASAGAPRPVAPSVVSGRDVLHQHLQRLTLLVNGGCPAPERDCAAMAREVLATAQAIRADIARDQDPSRFQPAVQIIDQLNGVTPASQDRIFDVGRQLQSWLAKNLGS